MLINKLINIGADVLFGNVSSAVLSNNYLTENHYAVFEYDGKKTAVITAGDNDQILNDYFSKIDLIVTYTFVPAELKVALVIT